MMKSNKSKRKSRIGEGDANGKPQYLYVHRTNEIHQLASELVDIFHELSSSKGTINTGTLEVKRKIDRCRELIVLSLLEGAKDVAIQNISNLGIRKNHEFSPSPNDYYERCRLRDDVLRVRAANKPLATITCGASMMTIPHAKSANLSWERMMERQTAQAKLRQHQNAGTLHDLTLGDVAAVMFRDYAVVTNDDVVSRRLGSDPLEDPRSLLDESGVSTEIIIFLEHYLLFDLSEDLRNLADTKLEYCPVKSSSVALLTDFIRCYSSFAIIRTDLIGPNRELSRFIDDAHQKVLRLAEIVQRAVLSAPPHKISIIEQGNALAFAVDGAAVMLTLTQKETLVVLALVGRKGPFPVDAFVELVPSNSGKVSNTFINRINALKEVLPRIGYDSVKGNRILRNIIFVDVATDERLKKFLDGELGSDE